VHLDVVFGWFVVTGRRGQSQEGPDPAARGRRPQRPWKRVEAA